MYGENSMIWHQQRQRGGGVAKQHGGWHRGGNAREKKWRRNEIVT